MGVLIYASNGFQWPTHFHSTFITPLSITVQFTPRVLLSQNSCKCLQATTFLHHTTDSRLLSRPRERFPSKISCVFFFFRTSCSVCLLRSSRWALLMVAANRRSLFSCVPSTPPFARQSHLAADSTTHCQTNSRDSSGKWE